MGAKMKRCPLKSEGGIWFWAGSWPSLNATGQCGHSQELPLGEVRCGSEHAPLSLTSVHTLQQGQDPVLKGAHCTRKQTCIRHMFC